jgi:hypothetical protein
LTATGADTRWAGSDIRYEFNNDGVWRARGGAEGAVDNRGDDAAMQDR